MPIRPVTQLESAVYAPIALVTSEKSLVHDHRKYPDKSRRYFLEAVTAGFLRKRDSDHHAADREQKKRCFGCAAFRKRINKRWKSKPGQNKAKYKKQIGIHVAPPKAQSWAYYSGSVRKINLSSQGATRRMFVVPGMLNGTPAVTTI